MAREEHPREDLLAEARNLVERVSLRLPPPLDSEEVVAGFRRDGSLSVYFGQERVYQFTSAGALRRAYVDGLLYKAEAGRLVAMRRERTPDAVRLVSTTLDADATGDFLSVVERFLAELHACVRSRNLENLGQFPLAANVVGRLEEWLDRNSQRVTIASSPRTS